MAALSEVSTTMRAKSATISPVHFMAEALMSTDTTFGQLELRWVTTSGLRS